MKLTSKRLTDIITSIFI